jgi:hypothetical protein
MPRKTTTIFFSGQNLEVEDMMRESPKIYHCCGVLLSYYDLKADGANRTKKRLRRLIRKNREEK